MFLLKEILKSFFFSRKKRIGFILDVFPSPYYGKIMASARLRAYDVIDIFRRNKDYFLELYKPWKRYDIVVFQKKFDDKALKRATKLKRKGTKVILDINVNYYDKTALPRNETYQHSQILKFTQIADGIIASTEYIERFIEKIFPEKKVVCIPEIITDDFFRLKKTIRNTSELKLLYSGYAVKAKEILLIEKVLLDLKKNYNFSLIIICEKNPKISISGIESEFIKYRQRNIHKDMLKGDIFVAPRDLSNSYNLGHSFTKIGYPMSVGIPAIASRIPAYTHSPAILCETNEEWLKALENLFKNSYARSLVSKAGIEYCKRNFSGSIIKEKYLNFFQNFND